MAALLAAEAQPPGAQGLEDVPVADGGRLHGDAGVAHGVVEAEVAHHGGDDGVVLERAALVHRQRADRQDHVAVDDLAVGGHGQAAVGVAVVGDPEVGALLPHHLGERREVGGSDAVVDVPAVGVAADRVHGRAGPAIDVGAGEGGRAVGAVDDQPEAGQRLVDGGEDVARVVLRRVGQVADAADVRAGGAVVGRGAADDRALDRRLERVGQLVPAAAEQLDAVVGHRVVAGGDHDAEVRVVQAGEVGQRRGRDDPGAQHLGAGAGQPGDDRGLQHLPAGARVTADDRDGTACPVAVGEHGGGGTRHRQGQLRREVGVGPTPDAVGPEQATQRTTGQRLEY